jgi:spore coat-associated protein S
VKEPNREPLGKILDNYDIQVQSIKTETYKDKKAVWWIETNRGLMVLKKISNSEQTLKYILSAVKHLAENGVHFPPLVCTRDGKDYTVIDRTCYVLSEAVKGKNPSFDSEKELKMIIQELAGFHCAAEGFEVLPDTKPKIHLGKWKEDLIAQLQDMKVFYDLEVPAGGLNEIGKFIMAEFPCFSQRASAAINRLDADDYSDWVKKAGAKGTLCHQDFTAGNLILHPSGILYVLDTDGITVDIPARDLRKILCKIMKKRGKWDFELTKKIMQFYQAVNPLSPSEWRVVMTDIMYPHLFIGAMNKYYYRRDKEWSEQKYFQRIKEMCAFEKTIKPILDNFDALIPV